MNYQHILIEEKDHITRLTINRPQVLNALNSELIGELNHYIMDILQRTHQPRALILTGSGEKAFVAGADIAEMKGMSPEQAQAFAQAGQRLTRHIEKLPFPTIARVQGFALGGGCELAMACDMIIASTSAKFGQPEVGLGLIPGFGGTQRLIRRVGYSLAMEILLAGRHLTGSEAEQAGLANKACIPEELDSYIDKVVKKILRAGPRAIAKTKQLAHMTILHQSRIDEGLQEEANQFASCFADEEAHEGMSAFLEKRSANFINP